MKKRRGFSILEILVVAGITLLIGVIGVATLLSRRNQVSLDSESKKLVATLREAQSRSMAQASSSAWGVHMENATSSPFFVLFAGTYSSTSIILYEKLPTGVVFSTSSIPTGSSLEITFAQITGIPSTSTSIGLKLTTGGIAATNAAISRPTSGKIFFDDFNRSSL